ncbi:hypothetical protein ABPG75_006315 [Micractinium tetrahymenae]
MKPAPCSLLCSGTSPPLAPPETLTLTGINRTINICTSDYAPVVYCLDREPSSYGGYEIALFQLVQEQLGWPDAQLNWTCMEWYEMLDHLEAGDGACDLAVAGVDISRINLEKGITFTYPTLSGGYRILVATEDTGTVNYWIFMNAFEWQLWLAILLTGIGIGLILWGVERWANVRPPPPGEPPFPKLQPLVFGALGRPMQMFDVEPRNFAGRFILLIFAFMMLVLTAVYTGSTAANLTASQLQSSIRSVEDLPGKRVGTWDDPEYTSDLSKRGITVLGYPWNTDEDLQNMFDAVRQGDIQALVLDSYVLEYSASSQCDLMLVGGTWDDYDQAVAFPSNFDDSPFLKEYNRILVALKDMGQMENLERQWINPPEATCKTRGVTETTTQISFQEVSGLWILLAASVGVAGVLVIASQLALISARRMARSGTFKRARATLRRLQSMRTRRGSAASGGGGPVGCWLSRQAAPVGTADVALAVGSMPGHRHSLSKDLDGGSGCASGSAASEEASVAQVLAAVQRVEHMLHASHQQLQHGRQQEPHMGLSSPSMALPYAASGSPV